MSIIETQNLTYSYRPEVSFKYPDLNCKAGQELLILGNSGQGKTTLLHLLGLILPLQKGKVLIKGTNTSSLTAKEAAAFRAQNIGLIFQQHHFIQSLNVMDNLLLANHYAKSALKKSKAKLLAEQLEISDLIKKPIYELSGGEMQRVGIARALMNEPKLVLADEPTSNLDDKNCKRVYELLSHTAKENNTALIIVTHDQRLKSIIQNQITI